MRDRIKEYLIEMLERLKVEINSNDNEIIKEYVGYIANGLTESYYTSGNYVVDCNFKEQQKSDEIQKNHKLQGELDGLYKAISSKGYNFYYDNGVVYETGFECVGGTKSANYTRKV